MGEYKEIGFITVDSGCVMVGDPCYEGPVKKELDKFWDSLSWNSDSSIALVPHKKGHQGKAIVISGFGGDGAYPVFVKEKNGKIQEIKIVFEDLI